MSQDFLLVYDRLKVKMFYAITVVFAVRFAIVIGLEYSQKEYSLLFLNLIGEGIIILNFFFLFFKKQKIKMATLILIYLNTVSIFYYYYSGINSINNNLFVARDLAIINILILITAFMAGRKHTLFFSLGLIVAFGLLPLFKIDIFTEFLPYIIFYIVIGCFVYSLLANLIETTVKMTIDAKKEVERLSEFKHNTIRLIFHDLKVPVSSIINLNKNESNDNSVKTVFYAENIKKQLENVLDIERLEEPELKIETKNESVCDMINRAILSIEVLASLKSVKIITNFQSNGYLPCDRNLIERVFINLISNAIKYSPNNKTIVIDVNNVENSCKITVKDEGIGIDHKHLDKIFDKYYIINPQLSRYNSSNGLGLTFCKLAVKAHGGNIKVVSEVNKGSEFIVELPGFSTYGSFTIQNNPVSESKTEFTSAEKQQLALLCEKIKAVPIYKIGEIIPLVKPFENGSSENIKLWVNQLTNAIYSGDQDYYQNLISKIIRLEL